MPLLAHDLTLPDTDQTELYIRVTTSSTLALQGSLATFDAVIRTAQQRTLIFAVLLSIMSAFLLIQVTYWIVLKQPLRPSQYFGIALIVIGVVVVSR